MMNEILAVANLKEAQHWYKVSKCLFGQQITVSMVAFHRKHSALQPIGQQHGCHAFGCPKMSDKNIIQQTCRNLIATCEQIGG